MSRPARPAMALALLLVLAPAAWAAGIAPRTALAGLEREWSERLLARRPTEATRLGLHARDGALVPVTEDWIVAERVWLADFATRLAALPPAGASGARAVARDSLAARVARLRELDEVRRVWAREPSAYADLIGAAVGGALGRASACDRAHRAARGLRDVPETLRAARINLREPSAAAIDAGARAGEALLQRLRTEVPARTEGCRDAYSQAALAEADTAAVRAVEAFVRYLREDLRPPASR